LDLSGYCLPVQRNCYNTKGRLGKKKKKITPISFVIHTYTFSLSRCGVNTGISDICTVPLGEGEREREGEGERERERQINVTEDHERKKIEFPNGMEIAWLTLEKTRIKIYRTS
jgi:hypothetical protein